MCSCLSISALPDLSSPGSGISIEATLNNEGTVFYKPKATILTCNKLSVSLSMSSNSSLFSCLMVFVDVSCFCCLLIAFGSMTIAS